MLADVSWTACWAMCGPEGLRTQAPWRVQVHGNYGATIVSEEPFSRPHRGTFRRCADRRAAQWGFNSPLTKSGSSDSLRLRRFGRVIGDGDGAVGGGSGRLDGDVGGDASLAGTRVLRPAAGAAAGSRFRRVRGAGLQAVLCAEDGRAVAAAGTVFPHAHDRLFRGDRQRARHRMAVRGLVLAARFPAAVEPGQGPRSFVAVAHALASSARGA